MRIAQFRVACRGCRYAAVTTAAVTTLMRHFLPPTHLPAHLSGSMTMRSPAGALIARAGAPARLQPADPRALTGTVNVAVIAAAADPHLHRTTPAVVEPITRLAQPPQCPSQNTGQCSGKAGIKGLHKCLSQALRTEGSGVRTLIWKPRVLGSLIGRRRAYRRARSAPRHRPINTRPSAADGGRPGYFAIREKESVIRTDTDAINQPGIARGNRRPKSAPIARKARVSTAINTWNTWWASRQ